jgi:alanyl-tRNA synthetase
MAERLYYGDSRLLEFDAVVTDIRERSRAGSQSVWQIALDRTAFYPTSGGQPHDIGLLTATSPGGATLEAAVFEVEEDEAGEVWHLTGKPVAAGTRVRGRVDGERRIDHVQQHSGQHLISALFARELDAPTVSFHLGEETSTIDLAIKAVSEADLARLEDLANRTVAEARPVTGRTVSGEEAQAMLAAGRLRKLPPRPGAIRLIEIPELDLNACGGTHVRSTAEIGVVLLRGTEKVRQGVRVSFVCGNRAIRAARADHLLLSQLGAALSTGRADLAQAVIRLQAENKAVHKEAANLREELANYHAARLLVEDPIHRGRRVVRRLFHDRDAAYIKLLAARVTSAPQTIALFASTAESPASIVAACSTGVEFDCGQRLREVVTAFGGRGGGVANLAQAQVPVTEAETVLRALDVREPANAESV